MQAGPRPGQELGGEELPHDHLPGQQSPRRRKVPPLLLRRPARSPRLWVVKDGADSLTRGFLGRTHVPWHKGHFPGQGEATGRRHAAEGRNICLEAPESFQETAWACSTDPPGEMHLPVPCCPCGSDVRPHPSGPGGSCCQFCSLGRSQSCVGWSRRTNPSALVAAALEAESRRWGSAGFPNGKTLAEAQGGQCWGKAGEASPPAMAKPSRGHPAPGQEGPVGVTVSGHQQIEFLLEPRRGVRPPCPRRRPKGDLAPQPQLPSVQTRSSLAPAVPAAVPQCQRSCLAAPAGAAVPGNRTGPRAMGHRGHNGNMAGLGRLVPTVFTPGTGENGTTASCS